VTSSGQAEAVPVTKAILEEPPTQTAQTWVSAQAKVPETETVSKMDVDEAPRGTEDAGLGASAAVGTSLKPEEDEHNDEAVPRLPSSWPKHTISLVVVFGFFPTLLSFGGATEGLICCLVLPSY
jgi:hypothetical protein